MTHDELRDALVASYRTEGATNHVGAGLLPAQQAVDALAAAFMRLLFPGFFERDCLGEGQLPDWTGARLADLRGALAGLIALCPHGAAAPADLASAWLCALPDIRRLLRTDVEAAYEGDPAAASFEEIILAYPCVPAIALQRVAHAGHRLGVGLLPRMLTEYAHRATGIDIHPGARIASHFFIDHGTGVVIGETVTLGRRVKIYQGVTLGAKSFPRDDQGNIIKGVKRHPDIEDGVTIYAGATILGGDTRIGAGSIVGANVWLMESVPPQSIVLVEDGKLVVRRRRSVEPAEGHVDSGSGI